MATKKKPAKKTAPSKSKVNLSVIFSEKTAVAVDEIADSDFRSNRSMAVESMVVESPRYQSHSKKRSRNK